MASHNVICSVLSYLISQHGYGSPTLKQKAVNRAGVRSDQLGEAKEAYEELREAPFINEGERGLELDNSQFGLLADYLYVECDWGADEIHTRLKHYEGWGEHTWTEPE